MGDKMEEVYEKRRNLEEKILDDIRNIPAKKWECNSRTDILGSYQAKLKGRGKDYDVFLSHEHIESGWEPDGGFYWNSEWIYTLKVMNGQKEIASYNEKETEELFDKIHDEHGKMQERRKRQAERRKEIKEDRKYRKDTEELEKEFG
ncbi:MAG: hypothetical protein HZB68_05085 [Candidatus Aenigmarchaeota archaeon]|nr:hypothetical protein [Candidatus Aenigmarchaeota archaeon]